MAIQLYALHKILSFASRLPRPRRSWIVSGTIASSYHLQHILGPASLNWNYFESITLWHWSKIYESVQSSDLRNLFICTNIRDWRSGMLLAPGTAQISLGSTKTCAASNSKLNVDLSSRDAGETIVVSYFSLVCKNHQGDEYFY